MAKYHPGQGKTVSDLADFTKNVLPFLTSLEEDEAGPDPVEISQRFDIPEERIVMLSRNENPYGPSPHVRTTLQSVPLHRYPDSRPFVKALAGYTGYPEECLITGAGMDEIITTICRIFLGPGEAALIPVPTYNFYGVAVELCGAVPLYQPRLSGFAVDPEIPKKVKIAFLCSPNNPTGNALSEENVRAVVESTDAIVFLDEAYAEFAGKSLLKMVKEYDNLVVGRTFSKAFGLAGLRLGYAVAPPWVAQQYRRVGPLFSTTSPSLAAGLAALQDLDWMRECVGKIVSERERMRESLDCANPSEGNFLYVHTREKSKLVAERVLSRGIIVRDCSSFPGSGEHCLRVTVGRPEENERFLEEFERADKKLSG
ncbi:MAG: histidinol-phosphate transaminase [Methanotrichaceae archaeon]|nr:histidinol-phosphate transaminase [Methanotrichaceae archaeon]